MSLSTVELGVDIQHQSKIIKSNTGKSRVTVHEGKSKKLLKQIDHIFCKKKKKKTSFVRAIIHEQ
jgi:hypothetical protein